MPTVISLLPLSKALRRGEGVSLSEGTQTHSVNWGHDCGFCRSSLVEMTRNGK